MWRIKTVPPLLKRKRLWAVTLLAGGATLLLSIATALALQPVPEDLAHTVRQAVKPVYLDRYGNALNVTYENPWNLYDQVNLHDIPEFLQQAFIAAEDKRFFEHNGIDWMARFSAAKQNLLAGQAVRGASTISEQVVKMLHPRPRTLWARWLEGFEAQRLEQTHNKAEILEFYLNQVPYQARRRGVKQAANYYFDRDLATLSHKEMLALAVFVRAPNGLDPQKHQRRVERAIASLATRMQQSGSLDDAAVAATSQQALTVQRPRLTVNAQHFIAHLQQDETVVPLISSDSHITTTLDAQLQSTIQRVLDARLDMLAPQQVHNGAVLVVDHSSNEILAWVVGYAGRENRAYNQFNPVISPRQPGSTLKPFVYAKALEKGWTAATLIDDSPLEESVGLGMHRYHNYSRDHYGMISVREALGNSLNIPAVRALQFVGSQEFLAFLHNLGVHSLQLHPNVYGDGVALGNGELTLLELVQAYTALARMGDSKPLSVLQGQARHQPHRQVISEDIASLLADILSDAAAREKEFGLDSILNLPYQTAVKTGTSSDYRDAWALGFNDRHTVGVWLGNLDYREMQKVTGATGPAVILRTVFNELNRSREVRPLYVSPHLERLRVCIDSGLLIGLEPASAECEARDEWFVAGVYPAAVSEPEPVLRIRSPTPNLLLAMDPRIPDRYEYFQFELTSVDRFVKAQWYVNDQAVGISTDTKYAWPLQRGVFTAKARVWLYGEKDFVETAPVGFTVN